MRDPEEDFETWLLRRVVQAAEAGEVSADLLTELRAEFDTARQRPQEESHAVAIQHMANHAGVPEAEARSALEAIEALPNVTQELLPRRFVEAWLKEQRKVYREQRDSWKSYLGHDGALRTEEQGTHLGRGRVRREGTLRGADDVGLVV